MTLFEITSAMNDARSQYRGKVSEIKQNEDISDLYKKRLTDLEREAFIDKMQNYREQACQHLAEMISAEQKKQRYILDDERLLKSIQMLRLTGKSTPEIEIKRMIEEYKTDRQSLAMLAPILEEYHFTDACMDIEEYMKVPTRLEKLQALDDNLYYSGVREESYTPQQMQEFYDLEH